jgi:predicted acylesterase/phospholipase RssA
MQRFTNVGITNVLTGAFVDNTSGGTLDTNLEDVLYASFSYAGFFPPAESMGGTWFDGSVIWDLDVFSAVNKCLETHEQSDVVVDILLTSAKTLKQVDASNYNSI